MTGAEIFAVYGIPLVLLISGWLVALQTRRQAKQWHERDRARDAATSKPEPEPAKPTKADRAELARERRHARQLRKLVTQLEESNSRYSTAYSEMVGAFLRPEQKTSTSPFVVPGAPEALEVMGVETFDPKAMTIGWNPPSTRLKSPTEVAAELAANIVKRTGGAGILHPPTEETIKGAATIFPDPKIFGR